jgi:hypothetical protein
MMNRFIDHLQAVTTNNYNTLADSHTLQLTRPHSLMFSRPLLNVSW